MYDNYLIDPSVYQIVFYGILLVLCAIAAMSRLSLDNSHLILGQKTQMTSAWILFLISALFLGLRPVAPEFADTVGYAVSYAKERFMNTSDGKEFFWKYLQKCIHDLGGRWMAFSVLVALIYVGGIFYACYRWFGQNVYVGMLFVMSLFSFYAFGVNTIRNGLAIGFVMAGMAALKYGYWREWRRKEIILALLLFVCGYNTHHTVLLPICCFLFSAIFLKDIKYSSCIWIGSLIASLFIGNETVMFFEHIDVDDRLERYVVAGQNTKRMAQAFSRTGFRWDFLIYGLIPIIMGWYVIVKRKIRDHIYIVIVNTYILANAFWLLVIRAAFNDRFAFLSWFLYGIVIGYPVLRLQVFKRQSRALFFLLLGTIMSTWAFIVMWSLR